MSNYAHVEEIARKLRATAKEFGQKSLEHAVVVSSTIVVESFTAGEYLCGLTYVYAPTICITTLGNVEYNVARFF